MFSIYFHGVVSASLHLDTQPSLLILGQLFRLIKSIAEIIIGTLLFIEILKVTH